MANLDLNLNFIKNIQPKVNFKKKDINFFAVKKSTVSSSKTDLLLVCIPIGVACIMAGIYGYNAVRLNDVSSKFAIAENQLKSYDLKTKQPILEKYTLTRDMLNTYYTWVNSFNEQLRNYRIIETELLNEIVEKMGSKVECKDITMKNNAIEFNGAAATKADVSEFQKKCENIEGLTDVFVHSINRVTVEADKSETGKAYDQYEFLLSAKFKSFANETEPEATKAPEATNAAKSAKTSEANK